MKFASRLAFGCVLAALCASCHRKQAAPVVNTSVPIYEIQVADKTLEPRLLNGFFESTTAWRWTEPEFAVALDAPPPLDSPMSVDLDFTVPEELMQKTTKVAVSARVNGQSIGNQTYQKSGRYHLSLNVPPAALRKSANRVEFAADKSFSDAGSGQTRSLIVISVGLKHPEDSTVSREVEAELARAGYQRLLEQRKSVIDAQKQNEMMKLFHDLPVWRNMWFQNVQIEKNPLDLWMMQQIIYEEQPEFIVETGTWHGGSALYWAHTLEGMGLTHSRVITMDIQDLTKNAAQNPLWKNHVDFFKGSSTDPAIVAEVARRAQGHKVLVTLDSDHTMRHVLDEIHAYAPLVNKGSYLVVEDTHMDGVPTQPGFGPGPMAAVRKFLAEGGSKDFEQDLTREALVMTFNPGGWLRRK